MVCAPRTSRATLKAIKNKAKILARSNRKRSDRAACLILYHGCIAAAYKHHGAWISVNEPAVVIDLYADFAQVMDSDPLAQVFRSAVRRFADENTQ